MDEIALLRDLFDHKVIDILRLFLSNQSKQFYLKEISDSVKVPMATTHRILKSLVKSEIIKETNISKFKIYQLADNPKVKFLNSFIKESIKVVSIFVDKISHINGINRIILHGKEEKTRANILIIGQNIDVAKIKELVADIKEEYNYYISYMTLTEEQYDQMSNMGLYSGQKKLLFEK
ncbi:MAG: winged helix-turn-helix domain-containing protein [Nanoarchaeota archaeon]